MSDKLTFEEFQATRKRYANLQNAPYIGNTFDYSTPGYTYDGTLWIENLPSGRYYLILTNDDYVSDKLEDLEHKLYNDWYLLFC